MKKTFDYFSKGFSLANKSFDLLLIAVSFVLVGQFNLLVHNQVINNFLNFINFILMFFNFGFVLSIPLFLLWKQQNKPLNYTAIWATTLKNTKRSIIPIIFIIFLFLVILVITALILLATGPPTPEQIKALIDSLLHKWNPIFFILGIILSFFAFTSIYFSIEESGLLTSIKKSITFSFKNLTFIGILIVIYTLIYSLSTFMSDSSNNWIYVIKFIINEYLGLIITASVLYFYQSRQPQ